MACRLSNKSEVDIFVRSLLLIFKVPSSSFGGEFSLMSLYALK